MAVEYTSIFDSDALINIAADVNDFIERAQDVLMHEDMEMLLDVSEFLRAAGLDFKAVDTAEGRETSAELWQELNQLEGKDAHTDVT